MLPTKSNTAEQGCVPVSSNCVVWQGPNLACLNLCNGDTVSDVVYKVAEKLCTIQSELVLTDQQLSCLLTFCSSVGPAPTTKTVSAVLDFIIKKVCCLNTRITTLESGSGSGSGTGTQAVDPLLNVAQCLQFQDPATGQTITQLAHTQYTLRIGNQYCSLKAVVDQHTSQITTLTTRVTALEARPIAQALPTVVPNCILTPGTATAMNLVLDELENQYCLLRGVLGTNTQLTTATASQCANLSSANALSQPGTMSGYTGWNASVTNLAQAFQNLWITVCDIRAAVASLKGSATVDCTQFVLSFDASANNDRTEITLDFNPGTIIPAGFSNAAIGSKVVVSDGTNSKTFDINLTNLAASGVFTAVVAGGSVVGTALNTSQPYTVTVTGNITKDGQNCNKNASKTISVPCPIITNVTATII